MLFKTTQATVHGVSSGINDFCVGQNQAYEPDVGKIVRHFVGEVNATSSVTLSLRNVLVAQFAQLLTA
jgi:hypothetical protein